MRGLIIVLALAVTPFVAGVAQSQNGSNCDNGQGDEHRSTQGTLHAHRGQCDAPKPPPAPTCAVTAPQSLGTTAMYGRVYNSATFAGLSGWCLHLTGTVTATVMSDASGNYAFTGMPGGTYTVCEDVQSGWQETFPGSWSGATCPTGYGWSFTLANGDVGSFLNFGNTLSP